MQVPTPYEHQPWTDRLALDVALSLEDSSFTIDELLTYHHLTEDQLLSISADPLFQRAVRSMRDEVREKGLTFRMKARVMADSLLKTSWQIIHSESTPPSVKSELIRSTVKWANLEPKNDTPLDSTNGARIIIQIGGQERSLVGLEMPLGRVLEQEGEAT